MPRSWTIPADADLRWRTLDGERLLFHPPSGDTHRLAPLAVLTLECLTARPATLDVLTTQVAERTGAAGEPRQLAAHLGELLARLEELGLVVAVAEPPS